MKAAAVIHLCATNDTNGNPRRCYVALSENGIFLGAFDEGYAGYLAVPKELQKQAQYALRIEVSGDEVEKFLAWHDDLAEQAYQESNVLIPD